jgi:hypothetical protein
MTTTRPMSAMAETCLAQRYSPGARRSSPTARPVHGEEPVVDEPGDDDGTGDEAEEVAGDPEEDELERAHGSDRAGRARRTGPA